MFSSIIGYTMKVIDAESFIKSLKEGQLYWDRASVNNKYAVATKAALSEVIFAAEASIIEVEEAKCDTSQTETDT